MISGEEEGWGVTKQRFLATCLAKIEKLSGTKNCSLDHLRITVNRDTDSMHGLTKYSRLLDLLLLYVVTGEETGKVYVTWRLCTHKINHGSQ